VKLEIKKTSLTCKPTNKIKARREQHYCIITSECCLTNCSTTLQMSTHCIDLFVFVINW